MEWRAYDLASPDTALPEARMGHTANLIDSELVWGEDLLVIFGGLSAGKTALNDVHIFQVQSQVWSTPDIANQGPAPRSFHCSAACGLKLYIYGGHVFRDRNVHKFGDLWCLDTTKWEWTQILWSTEDPYPCSRDFFSLVAVQDNRLLLFAGLDSSDRKLNDTWQFLCDSSEWTELKLEDGPKPRHGHAMATIGQQVFMCGGETTTGPVNDSWILRGVYQPSNLEQPYWTLLETSGIPMSPRKAHAMAGIGSQVAIFGGHSAESGWFSRRHEVYHNDLIALERKGNVSWLRPAVSGSAPSAREYHTLTAITTDRLLLFGGGNGRTIFQDAAWLCLMDVQRDVDFNFDLPSQELSSVLPMLDLASSSDIGDFANEGSLLDHGRSKPPRIPERRLRHKRQSQGKSVTSEFERLCKTLGAIEQPLPDTSHEAAAFQQLGRKQLLDATSCSPPDPDPSATYDLLQPNTAGLARHYLSAQETSALKMSDIQALLWDYKQISPGLHPATFDAEGILTALEQLTGTGKRQFSHIQAGSLRIGDLGALHAEYKQLLLQHG